MTITVRRRAPEGKPSATPHRAAQGRNHSARWPHIGGRRSATASRGRRSRAGDGRRSRGDTRRGPSATLHWAPKGCHPAAMWPRAGGLRSATPLRGRTLGTDERYHLCRHLDGAFRGHRIGSLEGGIGRWAGHSRGAIGLRQRRGAGAGDGCRSRGDTRRGLWATPHFGVSRLSSVGDVAARFGGLRSATPLRNRKLGTDERCHLRRHLDGAYQGRRIR